MINTVLNIIFNGIIVAFGVWVYFLLRRSKRTLEAILDDFSTVKNETTRSEDRFEKEGDLHRREVHETIWRQDKLDALRTRFDTAYADYVSLSQQISLFPLLGILGTVAGLIAGSRGADIDQLVGGLGTAMLTTLLGLIFSIAYKWCDAHWLGRTVNLIDARFSEADAAISRQMLREELRRARTEVRDDRV